MLFSVLVAHYNNFDFFKVCYDSVLKQSYQNFEIILVDDCSTDDSFEKIKIYVAQDNRVKVFRNEENKGVGFTKRRCVELANGTFCGFVDPDDAIAESAIGDAIDNFDDNTVAVYSQFQLRDSSLDFKSIFPHSRQVKNNDPLFFNIFLEVNHFFTFRKSAYNKTSGINAELTSAVDQDLYLKLYETGDFKFIKKPNYWYRLHEKGVSQEKSKKGKLNKNWETVIKNACERRNIKKIYGKEISKIDNLPEYIYQKQNTIFAKLKRRFS